MWISICTSSEIPNKIPNKRKFRESFVKDGNVGGERAATKLANLIEEQLRQKNSSSKPTTILVRVYANFGSVGNGLAQRYATRSEKVTTDHFFRFVHGFNDRSGCDFIDCGSVHAKLAGMPPPSMIVVYCVISD